MLHPTHTSKSRWSGFKEEMAARGIGLAFHLAHHLPDRTIEAALAIAEKATPNPFYRGHLAAVRRHWGEPDGGFGLVHRGLRSIHPRVQSRLAENLFLKHHWKGKALRRSFWEKGMTVPFCILISPTMRCNLSCAGCYAGEYDQKDDLSPEVLDRILTEGKKFGAHMVILLGGEPLVYRQLLDLMATHSDVAFMMFTNGTLISPNVADRLRTLANVAPIFSLDGFEEETDARRGKGAFRRVMGAMDLCRERGLLFGFSCMVTRENLDTIVGDEFNDLLIQKGCFLGWHFLYMPVGRDANPSLMPTPEQRESLRTRGAALIRTKKPLFIADFWNDAPWVGGCIAGGNQYVHINSRGDVEPCIFCHFATENVKEKSLLECLQSPFFKAIRAQQPYAPNLLRPCMLIDHPQLFRRLVDQYGPRPTHPGAEELVGTLGPILDRYSQEAAEILDSAWKRDFESKGFTVPIGW